jgi:hypothetical protein
VYRGGEPRPLSPSPLNRLIKIERARHGRSLERVAHLSDGRISQSQVHRLETETLPQHGISDDHIAGLALGLSVPEATVRDAVGRSVPGRPVEAAGYAPEVQIVADRLQELPPAVRVRAARAADQAVMAFRDFMPPRWARAEQDAGTAFATLFDAWHDSTSVDELAEAAERAARMARDATARREPNET